MRTWVDASMIIALDSIGEVEILRELLGRVTVTKEVAREVITGKESQKLRDARRGWLEVREVAGARDRWRSLGLGRGEASMFLTPTGDRLVLDESPARTVAESEGRDYVGLLGLLLAGVDRGRVTVTRALDVVRRLLRSGFRVSTDLYDEVMHALDDLEGTR